MKLDLKNFLVCVFVLLVGSSALSQEARYDEDQSAFELRELFEQGDVLAVWVDPDGLTFPEREALYGFTVAPELLVDDFVMHPLMCVAYEANGWNWPEVANERAVLLDSLAERCQSAAAGVWLSRDEFHRVLASCAEQLAEDFGYSLHVEPEVFFMSDDPDHTTPLDGLGFVLTPIE